MRRILDIALNESWAMEETALERLLTIVAREHDVTDEALQAYRADALKNADRTTFRDGVAIMSIEGALFPKANLMTEISGATSYDVLRRDLQAALDDPKVTSILLNVNSPGGAVTGSTELAQAIYEARGKKPIVAYVNGMGASAAYLQISAADRIVVNDMAQLGSLGVMSTYTKDSERAGEKTFTFISSQSPLKNADPGTDSGAKEIQTRVDTMAKVFLETVARNRGVATETALNDFGRGGILVGEGAVKAGLADAVGSFESVLADLASPRATTTRQQRKQGTLMSETAEPTVATAAPGITAEDVAKAVADANRAERTRISGLNTIASAHGVTAADLSKAIEDGTDVAAFALTVANATSAKTAETKTTALEGLKTDETAASKPGASDAPKVDVALTERQAAERLADEISAAADAASGVSK